MSYAVNVADSPTDRVRMACPKKAASILRQKWWILASLTAGPHANRRTVQNR
jgi:hypothetical protein